MNETTMEMSVIRTKLLLFAVSLSLLGICSPAKADILVSNRHSHSIEWFDDTGQWIDTFAATGPRTPFGLAASPVNGDVFVATLTDTILRYSSNGQPTANWDTFKLPAGTDGDSVLFDALGNLYVARYSGAAIHKYSAADLSLPNPAPIDTIPTGMIRGEQMALDAQGNLCVASFADETVKCFDPTTHAVVFDYKAELLASGIAPTIQPPGLAFDANNRLYVSSTFGGQVAKEQTPHAGPVVLLASGLTPEVIFLTLDAAGNLYLPSIHNASSRISGCTFYACNDSDFTSDTVYQIDSGTGAVTNFITSHVWGPYQLIFANVTKCTPVVVAGLN